MAEVTAANGDRTHFRSRQYIAREAEAPEAIYRIDEGWACRFRLLSDGRRQITALFLPGDYCEPQWALGRLPAQPILALTNVRATMVPLGAPAENMLEHQRGIGNALVATLERQMNWLVTLGRRTAYERIAHLLCEVYERLNRCGLTYGQQCAMPLTQTDIADITGLTPVHVNRTLQAMRSANLIDLQSKWLRIPNLTALQQGAALA